MFSMRKFRGDLTVASREAAQRAYARLVSSDPVIRHRWLFANPWVAGFDDETDGGTGDDEWSKHDERVHELRSEAMAEIWAGEEWKGVAKLLSDGDAAEVVGRYVCPQVPGRSDAVSMLRTCLCCGAVPREKIDGFMRGFIESLDASERPGVLMDAAIDTAVGQTARMFRCAPLGDATWRLLDQQTTEVRSAYWRTISAPRWNWLTAAELTEFINGLLQVRRPRAAFHALGRYVTSVETSILNRVLFDVATVHDEPTGNLPIDRHNLSDALDALDGRAGVTREEMALLEYHFIEAPGGPNDRTHGIPNLELAVANAPALFARAVSLVYQRNGRERIPGTAADGTVHTTALREWCTEVRRLCTEQGRSEVGDVHIGGLLAHARSDQDERWPCGPVCDVMESVASPHIERGFHVAVRNARGAHWRRLEDGGEQERELAAKYRTWSQRLSFEYPYVSGVLERIAEDYEHEGTWRDAEAGVRKRLFN